MMNDGESDGASRKEPNRIEEIADALGELMAHDKVAAGFNRSGKGELFILKYLSIKDAPVLPTELGEALGSSASRISAALGSLEKKGQICREIDKSNRRNILVTITDVGRERTREITRIMRSHLIRVLTEMGEADAEEFFRLSSKFFELTKHITPDIDICGDEKR